MPLFKKIPSKIVALYFLKKKVIMSFYCEPKERQAAFLRTTTCFQISHVYVEHYLNRSLSMPYNTEYRNSIISNAETVLNHFEQRQMEAA